MENGKALKIAAIAVFAAIIVAAVSTAVVITNNKNDGSTDFIFTDFSTGGDLTGKCHYTDDYFRKSSDVYDESLATMSLCAAMSTMKVADYTERSVNIVRLLKDTGFENIEVNDDYRTKPGHNTLGVVAGSKIIDGKTLIAAFPRSGMYSSEWCGNFQIGTGENSEGMHEGFYIAGNVIVDFLEEYVKNKGISGEIQVWMSGYSRGAAAVNIAGGILDSRIDNGSMAIGGASLSFEDLFVYTFEAPMGAVESNGIHDEKYGNIFNIVNFNDVVVKVAMEGFGFGRFGKDIDIPNKMTEDYKSKLAEMLKVYENLPGNENLPEFTVDSFTMMKIDLSGTIPLPKKDPDRVDWQFGDMCDELMNIVCKHLEYDRMEYVDRVQDGIIGIFAEVFDNDYPDGTVASLIGNTVSYYISHSEEFMEIVDILTGSQNPSELHAMLLPMYTEVFAEMGLDIDPDEMAHYTSDVIIFFAGIFKTDDGERFVCDMYSLVTNMSILIQGHHYCVILAWLMSADPKY